VKDRTVVSSDRQHNMLESSTLSIGAAFSGSLEMGSDE
jgi:hypothetical protein